jgi:hypothetical protein
MHRVLILLTARHLITSGLLGGPDPRGSTEKPERNSRTELFRGRSCIEYRDDEARIEE